MEAYETTLQTFKTIVMEVFPIAQFSLKQIRLRQTLLHAFISK